MHGQKRIDYALSVTIGTILKQDAVNGKNPIKTVEKCLIVYMPK